MNYISYQPVLAAPGAAAAEEREKAAASSPSEAVAHSEDHIMESSCESVILALVVQLRAYVANVISNFVVRVPVAHCQHKQTRSLMNFICYGKLHIKSPMVM